MCGTPGHQDKPEHGATGLCQACYRRAKRLERGLKKPGPKPDPSKPYSRHGGELTHHGKRPKCVRGHQWVDGDFMLRSDGTRVCLVCIEEDQPMQCPAGHSYEVFGFFVEGYPSIRCRECNRLNQIPQRLKSKYGLTVTRLEEMMQAQNLTCPLCLEIFNLDKHNGVCVDHDHGCCKGDKTCGKCIRGILCGECNKKLHDGIDWHSRAIEYLKRYRFTQNLREEPSSTN